MALTPELWASQATTDAAAEFGGVIDTSQAFVFAAAAFPTEFIQASQSLVSVLAEPIRPIDVSQAHVFAAVLGKPLNRQFRCWAFSLDGHDFYVLRVGENETLIYDLTTGKWAQWTDDESSTWRAHLGTNWLGMAASNYLGGAATNIVAGDDAFGLLWTLDPDNAQDDSARTVGEVIPFDRKVMGYMPLRMRSSPRVNAVFLTLSVGFPAFDPATIQLRTSDDEGQNWTDHGTITVPPSQFNKEVMWRSLGLARAPGKLFEFTDTGATVRIDGADVRFDEDEAQD